MTAKLFTPAIILRLAMLLAAIAYCRTLASSFVLDDFGIIVINPWLESWRFIPKFFTAHVWASLGWSGGGNYYRPLFLLWLSFNRHLFGLTPAWWHLTAVALHLACSFLAYALAKRILRDDVTASLAALLFAAFPGHIEAVAWISGSSELLLAASFLAAFILYMDWASPATSKPKPTLLIGSIAAYTCALLAKETAMVLPFLVFAHSWVFPRKQSENSYPRIVSRMRGAFASTFPYLLVTLAYFVARTAALSGSATSQSHAPLKNVLLTLPAAILFYAQHLAWPFRLSYLYDFDLVTQPAFANFIGPLVAVVTISVVLWLIVRRSALAKFLLCWIAFLTAPAVAALMLFSRHDYVHDRYLYLPSVGFCILLATLIAQIAGLAAVRMTGVTSPLAAAILSLALAVVFAVSTFRQAAYWDNDIALLTWASQRAPHNPLARQLLAESYFGQGDYGPALNSYQQALALEPDSSLVNARIAMAHFRLKQFVDAQRYLLRAIDLRRTKGLPDDPDQYYYLSLTYLQSANLDAAETAVKRAIQLQPHALGYHSTLASLLAKRGDTAGAAAEARAELDSRAQYNAAAQRLLKP
jgi:tetratricopeptide (TPR) repeat protein